MEQQYRQESTGKRPIALPIALIILVFSLIGNVFFYSLYLQNKQQAKYETGLRVYDAAEGSIIYFQQTREELEVLLSAETLAERLASKYRLGAASEHGTAAIDLIAEAAKLEDGFIWDEQSLQARLSDMNVLLRDVGNYEGALKEEDRELLKQQVIAFKQNEAIASSFNLTIDGNRNAIIRLAAGYGWQDMAKELYASLLE